MEGSQERSHHSDERPRRRDRSDSGDRQPRRDRRRDDSKDNKPNFTVYIGKLGPRTYEDDIKQEFDRFGTISNINMKRGFCFIVSLLYKQEYDNQKSVDDAIEAMHDKDFKGDRIIVEVSGKI